MEIQVETSDPIVDVGIPTLGTSPYLEESIESVFGQTLTSWRLVISENGPGSDAVRDRLAPYLDDPRVHHLITGERVGPGVNHTRLIRAGAAPFVGILHDDDRWHPGFLERRVRFLEAHADCGWVFSSHVLIDDAGRPLGRSRAKLAEGVYQSDYFLPLLCEGNFIAPPVALVRRSAYEAVGAEYKDILFCDHEMWLRLSAHSAVGCLASWDVEYRLHPVQTSSKRRLQLAEHQFEVMDAVQDLDVPSEVRRRWRANAYVAWALDDVELGERRRAIGRIRSAVRSDPKVLLRPRVTARIIVTLAVLATGDRGRRALARSRLRRYLTRGTEAIDGDSAGAG